MSDYELPYTGAKVNELLGAVNENHSTWDSISHSYHVTESKPTVFECASVSRMLLFTIEVVPIDLRVVDVHVLGHVRAVGDLAAVHSATIMGGDVVLWHEEKHKVSIYTIPAHIRRPYQHDPVGLRAHRLRESDDLASNHERITAPQNSVLRNAGYRIPSV